MSRLLDHAPSRDASIYRWEDDGGRVAPGLKHRDLNSLLAQEQRSIMNAESAETRGAYETHRDHSIHTRTLINATSYPEHRPHVFARERATQGLIEALERDESLLARQFANGEVSNKAYQTRSRFLRQDRAGISDIHLPQAAKTTGVAERGANYPLVLAPS